MGKLIDTDDLKKILLEKSFYPVIVKAAMEQIPEAVVRCEHCKSWLRFSLPAYGNCSMLCQTTAADDYCVWGEQITNG